MRILMLSGDFYPMTSGGARNDWNFARKAVDKGHEVDVIADRIKETKKREQLENVDIRRPYRMRPESKHVNSVRGQVRRIITSILLALRLFFLVLREDFSVIYSTNHALHPVAKFLGFVTRVPVVNFIGYSPSINSESPSTPKSVRVFEYIIFRFFLGDLVLSRTPQVTRRIEEITDTESKLIHGILDPNDFCEEEITDCNLDIDNSITHLVHVARLVPIKNSTGALSLLRELPETYHLWIVGDGPRREALSKTASKWEIKERVTFFGELSHQETLKRIAFGDALLLTSYTEAYPTVVFESLSLSTQVFATPVGILTEIEHENLILYPVEKMANKIRSTDINSDKGRIDKSTLTRFSTERFANTVLDEMELLLD